MADYGKDLDEYLESLMRTYRPPKFPLSMYYSEGAKYLNLCQYETALEFLDKAVEHDPTSAKSLLKRSKCYIGLGEYEKAIDDADKVLAMYPSSVQGIDLKGQAQYLRGDFEGGFLTYFEGRKLRPANHELQMGKQLCEEALENSSHEAKFHKTDVANIPKAELDDEIFQKRLRSQRSARECFGKDAKFMEDLLKDRNLASIHGFCQEAVDYIRHRERFWCMETPLHSRKKRQKTDKKETKKAKDADKQIRNCYAARRRAESALQKGWAVECLSEAKKLLNMVESLREEKQKEKMKLKCDAYHLLSLACKQKNNSLYLRKYYLLKELEIGNEFNLTLQQTKAYHELGEIYQLSKDIRKAVLCLDRVVSAMSPEKIDELTPADASPGEIKQVLEAHDWANRFIAGLMASIRESIIEPVVDTVIQFSEKIMSENTMESAETEHSDQEKMSSRTTGFSFEQALIKQTGLDERGKTEDRNRFEPSKYSDQQDFPYKTENISEPSQPGEMEQIKKLDDFSRAQDTGSNLSKSSTKVDLSEPSQPGKMEQIQKLDDFSRAHDTGSNLSKGSTKVDQFMKQDDLYALSDEPSSMKNSKESAESILVKKEEQLAQSGRDKCLKKSDESSLADEPIKLEQEKEISESRVTKELEGLETNEERIQEKLIQSSSVKEHESKRKSHSEEYKEGEERILGEITASTPAEYTKMPERSRLDDSEQFDESNKEMNTEKDSEDFTESNVGNIPDDLSQTKSGENTALPESSTVEQTPARSKEDLIESSTSECTKSPASNTAEIVEEEKTEHFRRESGTNGDKTFQKKRGSSV